MTRKRKMMGALGERLAVEFLKRNGYNIVQRNFRCKLGEIDIVAEDGKTTVFIEVRSSAGSSYGPPAESILWRKKKRLITLANFYTRRFKLEDKNFRFDVISVEQKDGQADVKLIKDAFWEA